jgi:hypothetical protein
MLSTLNELRRDCDIFSTSAVVAVRSFHLRTVKLSKEKPKFRERYQGIVEVCRRQFHI